MDDKRNDPADLVDGWLEEILGKNEVPTVTPEAPAEEDELERIVQETLAENFGEELSSSEPETDGTQFFDHIQEDPAPEAPAEDTPAEDPEPPRKQRPAKPKGYGLWGIPHILATCVWVLLIISIGISLGRTLWLCAADVLALGKQGQSVTVTIEVSDRLPDIAKKLQQAGLVRYPNLFEQFARLTGKGDGILVGSITFKDTQVYDYNALINAMSFRGGSEITIDVLIPEGYSCAQIFQLLEEKGVCSVKDLEEYAANGEIDKYWFLDGVDRGHKYCLEGFLFPDTYNFYMNSDPGEVIEKLLDGFESRFTKDMLEEFALLNNRLPNVHLTMRELVTLASIIEKEKATAPEGYTIASVFYNRLNEPGKYPHLQSDATILYATKYYNAGQLVTDEQINASPYNTYTHKGLPAGPIANPGLESLKAAIAPKDTAFYFFVYDEEAGQHRFSKTLGEHTDWVNKLGLG